MGGLNVRELYDRLQKEMETCVGNKIKIGDGCTTGLIAREQL